MAHVKCVYDGFIDIHEPREEQFDWLVEVVLAADVVGWKAEGCQQFVDAQSPLALVIRILTAYIKMHTEAEWK